MTSPPRTLDWAADVLRRAGLFAELRGPEDIAVTGVSHDSRTVEAGHLFLAFRGTSADGHDFVKRAVASGASAAVVERWVEQPIPQLLVEDGRVAAALLAHAFAGYPSDHLFVAAVTGTNGKTTVTSLARDLLSERGPAAAIGTLGLVGPDGRVRPGSEGLTTPGPVALARYMALLVEEGVTSVSLEASSHALEQRRLDGISVDAACFTNLTMDHLDYHGTMEAYLGAKARLLERVGSRGGVVVNGCDPAWSGLPSVAGRLLMTGVHMHGEPVPSALPGTPSASGELLPPLMATDVVLAAEGSRFEFVWGDARTAVTLPLLGRFNVENAVAAAGIALLGGVPLERLSTRLSSVRAPAGRLEVFVRSPVPVVLDYAHTPDALQRVLETLKPLYPGRLIVVFGAGGDRDRSKRPLMGRAAAAGADLPIVTSDNPRTEDPEAIIAEIAAGMEGTPFLRVTDRRAAIERALDEARPGDVILLAGKGHENYQVIGTERRPFDERQILAELLGLKGTPT